MALNLFRFNRSKLMSLKNNLLCNQIYSSMRGIKTVRIGCASGFWGDTQTSAPQLIHTGKIDYLMFDYLSEITMSLLTASRAKQPDLGYAPDFVLFALGPHLNDIKRKGIRVISNAGGINPEACALALGQAAKKAGVDLKVAVVTGDDLMGNKDDYIEYGVRDIKSGLPLPRSVHSMNAYLGAGPIMRALELGADVVVTGRCADSALALGPLMHSFGWKKTDFDLLAAGSLAGHLIECGAQVTGGIFTDWWKVPDWHNIGFPIAEVSQNGEIVITKPPNTGGLISQGTVSEQLLYEIGDPRAYLLPDVVCDFTGVKVIEESNKDRVRVVGAKGLPPTDSYKVSATYLAGYKATAVSCIGGRRSAEKGRRTAAAILKRCGNIFKSLGYDNFSSTHVQIIGAEDTYGPHASSGDGPREAVIWMSMQHKEKKALQIFGREIAAAGTGMAPGLTAFIGGRPKPTPILRLHSFLVNKSNLTAKVQMGGFQESYTESTENGNSSHNYDLPDQPTSQLPELITGKYNYTLEDLAYTRSGDKGDSCNIGVIARHPALYPYIQKALTTQTIAEFFKHIFPTDADPVDLIKRYELDGVQALNFVMDRCLGGGGVASPRSDPQGKALGQMLLEFPVTNMPDIETLCVS